MIGIDSVKLIFITTDWNSPSKIGRTKDSPCGVMNGLIIISKYIDPNKGEIVHSALDDKIWSVRVQEMIDKSASIEDFEELSRLGWMIYDDFLVYHK